MLKNIGIYIHIPFCKKKCDYCDFISYDDKRDLVKKYIEALKKEISIEMQKIDFNKYNISTIYIGGGTPSYVETEYIAQILDILKKYKPIEITLEINPGTVNREKLQIYYEIGINRLSIGLQTTDDKLLKLIGRIHSYKDFLETYNIAREVGFSNINVDQIIGLPTQTLEDVKESIKNIVELKPEHISVYSLILEKGTKLEEKVNKKKIYLPNDELERHMYWETKSILENNGYIHYEISNFAKPGYESKHNISCWNQEEYIGFGVAAHSYFDNKRYSNTDKLEDYIKGISTTVDPQVRIIHEIQNKEMQAKEFMLLGLRKIEGVKISNFKNKFVDNPVYLYREELNELVKKELIELDINNIKLTNKGIDLANLVWEKFI